MIPHKTVCARRFTACGEHDKDLIDAPSQANTIGSSPRLRAPRLRSGGIDRKRKPQLGGSGPPSQRQIAAAIDYHFVTRGLTSPRRSAFLKSLSNGNADVGVEVLHVQTTAVTVRRAQRKSDRNLNLKGAQRTVATSSSTSRTPSTYRIVRNCAPILCPDQVRPSCDRNCASGSHGDYDGFQPN